MHQPISSGANAGLARRLTLPLAALGVVFGDIGTSPLYALRECFSGAHGFAPSPVNILGVLSLIFWALFIVISIKYLVFILRADHRGEGGILALSVLVSHVKPHRILTLLGLFGAALLYSDGMITPAISVLSAVEGLQIAAPTLSHAVIPITIAILIGLFFLQSHGTARVGAWFGPVTLLWFVVIAALGLRQIFLAPQILQAFNPWHGWAFFQQHGSTGFIVLGAVFLAVTGGEALYADIGHFGIGPIRQVWFALVLPALLLNYLGQGALLLRNPSAAASPFFALAPSWALYPTVLIAGAAAVIASQALITGAFSLTMESIQLGYSPRLAIRHTSAETRGQIYVPIVNWILMLCSIALVLGFGSSANLAAAYGVSITATMLITTILFFIIARWQWKWRLWIASLTTALFLSIDLAFFGSNILKVAHGGWFPLLAATIIFLLMITWRNGRAGLALRLQERSLPLDSILASLRDHPPLRVPGTAFFLCGKSTGTPGALLHNLKHNQVLHEQVVLLHIQTEEVPHLLPSERVSIQTLESGFSRMTLRFGFMEEPNVYQALLALQSAQFNPARASFFLGRETLHTRLQRGWKKCPQALFAWMAQNSRDATSFFGLPPNQVVELGAQLEL